MPNQILLIDDDPLVIKTLQRLLQKEGYSVVSAKSGAEASDLIRARSFDLIICDIRMPEENGISVIKRLKELCADTQRPEIPFLFITGYASEDAPIDAIKLGARDYLLKPFDLDELLKSVSKHIA